ncbi:MAG: hypothetical protein ACYDCL_20335 [Myxococcales bacterium]
MAIRTLATSLLLLLAPPPDGGLPDPVELRQQLLQAAMREEPCPALSSLLAQADSLLDAHENSDGYELLGEILRVWNQACPGRAPARHAPDADAAFSRAVDLRPDGGAGGPAVEWNGLLLRRSGEQRLARARAALAGGDVFAARRELRYLRYESVDAAIAPVDPEAERSLWEEVGRLAPKTRAPRRPSTAEDAIRALERAAVDDDASTFEALLSRRSLQHALFEGGGEEDGCAEYREDRSLLLMCLLGEILPEAPDQIACRPIAGGKAESCLVSGRTDQRTVNADREGSSWRLSASSPGAQE